MNETAPLILDIGLVLLVAAFLGWVARRVGLPAATGYLAAGLAVSPFTPGYVANREQIAVLADIGVIILLFEVGIEVDVRKLGKKLHSLFWVVPVQVVLTTALSAAALSLAGVSTPGALLIGLGIAFSSSVVIVNITRSQRRTTDKATEQALLGWSVVQDISGVSLAAVLIALTGAESTQPLVAIIGLILFCVAVIGAAQVVPRVLRVVNKERDLFLIVSVAVGLAIASAGAVFFGVPMALAAFVAGLAISDNKEMTNARAALFPFRDVFAVLFFVAVGSIINPFEVGPALPFAALTIGLVLFAKVLPAYVLARVSKTPARAGQLAIGLGQVGEFSFVLAAVGQAEGLISGEVFTGVVCAVLLTIPLSSVLVRTAGVRRRA
jgi:CPA2 family monovalent cation:H+ antiporter-2